MEPHCLPFVEIPHTSALLVDYLHNFSRLAQFYSHDPFRPGSFAAAAREVSLEEARRTAVADVLAQQNSLFQAGAETQRNIARLRAGRALAVVTGQQVGLFGGPAYSVYKALTAIRLAERLTAEGLPAAPVFWLASEDHDFAEVKHAVFLDAKHQFLRLSEPTSPGDNTPTGKVVFDASVEALRKRVRHLWPRELRQELEGLLAGYVPGVSYAHAFARLFQQLFAGRGLIILDPLHPTLHALARPLYRRALEEAEALHDLMRGRNRELEKVGYHTQVHLRENASLVFLTVNGHRLPLRRHGQGFFLPGRGEQERAELFRQLEAEPERFSANVLLRPLVQDSLLPTVAYVAGPNEMAYFAQASVLYQKLLGRMPVIVPRTSLTLVDSQVQRLLRKYQLTLADFFRGRPQMRTRLAQHYLPARLQRRLESTQARIEKLLAETAQQVKQLDPTLVGATDTSRRKMLYQFSKIRRKAARALAERNGIVDRHLETLFNTLYPHHGLQERHLNFLSFVARHGVELVPRLLAQANFPCRDHQVIFL